MACVAVVVAGSAAAPAASAASVPFRRRLVSPASVAALRAACVCPPPLATTHGARSRRLGVSAASAAPPGPRVASLAASPRPWPAAAAAASRRLASVSAPEAAGVGSAGTDRGAFGEARAASAIRWDITPEKWVDIKYTEEDLRRFPADREAFRREPRVRADAVLPPPTQDSIDMAMALRGFVSCFRLGDCYSLAFQELVWERFAKQQALMEAFGIPPIEDKSVVQEMHSKAVPGEGTYHRVRTQAYWLALHVWLLHNKQYALQANEGLFGSALCALLTRRLFESLWHRIRMLLHANDVPIMSISNELQDLQEFMFGFCVALDDVFKEEVVDDGTPGALARALAREESELGEGRYGLAPRIKYLLWGNVYSGGIPPDSEVVHELAVYFLRQKIMLDGVTREAFFSGNIAWADHPPPPAPRQ